MKRSALFTTVLCFAVFVPSLFAAVVYQLSDRSKVYLGSAEKIVSPGIVEIQKVYDQLPSYQEALKHPEGSAKRIHALKRASDEFKEILAKVSKEKKFEFVAEKGAITAQDSTNKKPVEIPDLTQDVIKAIPAK